MELYHIDILITFGNTQNYYSIKDTSNLKSGIYIKLTTFIKIKTRSYSKQVF